VKGSHLQTTRDTMRTTLSSHERRDLLVETQTKGDAVATASIASVSDQDWYISRTHGVYHIPACSKDQSYALVLITSRGDAIDLGDNRRFPFTISARDIAGDLLQDLHDHGIFVCAGARPTDDELSSARERRNRYYQGLIAEGDMMWARGHSFREISDLHRRAAISLGIEREWAYVPMRTMDCPVCGEKIKANVAVCKHCHGILDYEKAALHGLHQGSTAERRPVIWTGAPDKPEKTREMNTNPGTLRDQNQGSEEARRET